MPPRTRGARGGARGGAPGGGGGRFRTKQTAAKSTGGLAPRKQLSAVPAPALNLVVQAAPNLDSDEVSTFNKISPRFVFIF